jgi:hypothetical protein
MNSGSTEHKNPRLLWDTAVHYCVQRIHTWSTQIQTTSSLCLFKTHCRSIHTAMRKATISFVTRLPLHGFPWLIYQWFLLKSLDQIQFFYKSDKINGHCYMKAYANILQYITVYKKSTRNTIFRRLGGQYRKYVIARGRRNKWSKHNAAPQRCDFHAGQSGQKSESPSTLRDTHTS